MKLSKLFKEFATFLRNNKEKVVKKKTVLVDRWDPTYGQQDPGTEEIEYVDLDSLCSAIDTFSKELKKTVNVK